MTSPDNLYDALGVNRGAPIEVVRRAYRKAAKEAHPDAGGDPQRWALVCLAKDVLLDERKRKQYDETGETDAIEAQIKQVVYDAICQVAAQAARLGELTSFNIVGDAIQLLRMNLQNIAQAQANLRAGSKAAAKVIERFRPLDGVPDQLHAILAEQFQGAVRGQQQLEMQKTITERAIAILKEHRFDFTARDWFA